jgi:hypothetical protein
MRIIPKNKRSEEKRNYNVTLSWQQEKRIFEKNLYERRKERKEKYEMTYAVVYDLNGLHI